MNTETEKATPAISPGKFLTISGKRLAGSPACLNCGTELRGPFCYYCGQPDKNMMRFFPVLLRELLADTFDFDSRFLRTLKPLLLKPGKLTRDYLDGRRFRYVPPLRLYIFSSIAFFFLAAILAGDAIQIDSHEDQESTAGIQFGQEEQDSDTIDINGKPWDRETNPLILPLAPDWINDWVNNEIGESPEKGRQIEQNPNLIKDKVFDVFPVTMFVLLPIVALLFKFWYLFAKKYYVEHLIFTLHYHAFLFVVLLIIMLANSYAGWQEPSEEGPITTTATWISVVAGVWIPVYLLFSLKRVYKQGWWMTVAKFSCIGISYLVLLALTTGFAAVVSFVLL